MGKSSRSRIEDYEAQRLELSTLVPAACTNSCSRVPKHHLMTFVDLYCFADSYDIKVLPDDVMQAVLTCVLVSGEDLPSWKIINAAFCQGLDHECQLCHFSL
jgi:hypothetical protein